MEGEIRRLLRGVRSRQRSVAGFDGAAWGALLGAIVGVAIELLRYFGIPTADSSGLESVSHAPWILSSIGPWFSWCVVGLSALLGWCVGWLRPVAWSSTARVVDARYGLKDAAASALDFARRKERDEVMLLQIAETQTRLRDIAPHEIVGYRVPPASATLFGLLAAMVALPWLPRIEPVSASEEDTLVQQVVHDQAASLDAAMVEELRALAEESSEPELEQLVDKVDKLVDEMKQPTIDKREALSKLSEMQQSLGDTLNQKNSQKRAAEFKQLAEAMATAKATQPVAEALERGDFDAAARELKEIAPDNLTEPERTALAENLKKIAESPDAKQSALQKGAEKMQKGLEENDSSQFEEGAAAVAEVAEQQAARSAVEQNLKKQLNRLAESKGNMQAAVAGGAVQKSTRSSDKAGDAASNKPLGEETTQIESTRQEQRITGVQGAGDSQRETIQSEASEQMASREYAAQYAEFRRQMEQVIDSEPLPLGHRSTVRKYFESIRPSSSDGSDRQE